MTVDSGSTLSVSPISTTAGRVEFESAADNQQLGIRGLIGTRTLTYSADFGSTPLTTTQSISLSAGAAAKLGFRTGANATVQPATVEAGVVFDNAPTVEVQDAEGNLVTTSSTSVVARLYKGNVEVSPSVTSTKSASGGIATFDATSFSVTRGDDYTLVYTAAGLTSSSATNQFTITNGAPRTVRFTNGPVAIGAGISFGTFVAGTAASDDVPRLEVVDAAGNLITNGSEAVLTVSLTNTDDSAVTPPTGVTSATFMSGKTATTSEAVARLAALTIRATAGTYKMTVSGTVDGVDVPFSAVTEVVIRNGVLSTAVLADHE